MSLALPHTVTVNYRINTQCFTYWSTRLWYIFRWGRPRPAVWSLSTIVLSIERKLSSIRLTSLCVIELTTVTTTASSRRDQIPCMRLEMSNNRKPFLYLEIWQTQTSRQRSHAAHFMTSQYQSKRVPSRVRYPTHADTYIRTYLIQS